jgi:transposase-like protein
VVSVFEAELTAVIGAAPHERTESRTAQRNGSRPRTLTTTAGDLEPRIPELRAGPFFPSLLERRRRIDQALFAVVMEDDRAQRRGAGRAVSEAGRRRIRWGGAPAAEGPPRATT